MDPASYVADDHEGVHLLWQGLAEPQGSPAAASPQGQIFTMGSWTAEEGLLWKEACTSQKDAVISTSEAWGNPTTDVLTVGAT